MYLIKNLSSILNLDHVGIMDFCGTHEWTITHYGLRSLMPDPIRLIAGPGCPVCITPAHYVDELIKLCMDGVHVLTYGDTYRLPGSSDKVRSLAHAKSLGGKVTIVYSVLDAIKRAKANPNEEFVFFAVGFETTAPSTASPVYREVIPRNLKLLIAHRLTPPIIRYLFDNVPEVSLQGVIAPGHVSTIIGASAWEFIPREYNVSAVVAGFEPMDVLIAIYLIIKDLIDGKPKLHNEYGRAVSYEGNLMAKTMLNEVFEVIDAPWRGIGVVRSSGYVLKDKFRVYDAAFEYGIDLTKDVDLALPKGCRCGEVVLGKVEPTQCPLFMKVCTPRNPYGPCMVSIEGTCRIWAEHGGYVIKNLNI
ncbi:MAG: hydrogenase formation protein HypD [Thermoprotei archaeon]|nr:MAG: hydrogenase formation protein HypD [Desulfurococcales archaeon ex4484_42]RLG84900.1 MAG: hydrogenase formation protein HypD [Thermoprotei archaeon]